MDRLRAIRIKKGHLLKWQVASKGDTAAVFKAAAGKNPPDKPLQPIAHHELIFHNLFSRVGAGLFQADALGSCVSDDRLWCGHGAMRPELGTAAASVVAVHPEDRESVASGWNAAMESGREWSQEYRCLSEAGNVAWMHGTVRQLRDGNGAVTGYLGCNLDITARKEVQEELMISEGRFHLAMEAASAGLWDLDVRTDQCYFSPNCFQMLGYQPDSLRCDLEGWISIMHAEDLESARRVTHDCIENGAPNIELEIRMKTNEGKWRWFLCRGRSTGRDAEGKALRMVGTVVDISERKLVERLLRMKLTGTVKEITERKAVEKAIRQLNDALERRVSERTSQLAATKHEIESFSYSVSHDLRAPLRHINSYSAMLVEEYENSLPLEASDYLDRIRAASSRMGKLIDDLLRLTQVGRIGMKRRRFDVSLLAQEVADMLQEAQPDCAATFDVKEGLWADGDCILVRLVLENLLGNAMKYASRKHAARIEFGQTEFDGEPVFFVRDDGVGFDMAYAGNLFQPFQRLHGAEFEGTGIGLATVKRAIDCHGGSVWGEGKVNEGAAFYFTLSAGPKG